MALITKPKQSRLTTALFGERFDMISESLKLRAYYHQQVVKNLPKNNPYYSAEQDMMVDAIVRSTKYDNGEPIEFGSNEEE
jgi:hypothetical protein